MKFFYKKESDFFIFFKNDRQILTQKKFPLLAQCENHSKKIIQQISDKKKSPYSILSLSFFSSDLDLGDRKDIILKISKFLESDTILFRNFDDTELLNIMDMRYKDYISQFVKKFNINLKILNNFNESNKVSKKNNFSLTAIYKLCCITNSVILSYFFLDKKINYKELFDLVNIENKFQQNIWGYVDEQKKIDSDLLKIFSDISLFLKI
jgi:chaperone required for assembly of F1-ATPase